MLLLLPRIRAALGALLVGSGALLAGSGVSLAAIRDFPLTPGNAPRPYSIGVERGAASEGSPQPPLRLAASRPSPGEAVRQHSPPPPQPPKHAVPPPPQHADKSSKDAEPKRQDADKPQPKDAPPKQQDAAKKQAKDAEAHRRQADAEPKRQDADKPPVKDSDRGAPEKAKEHPTVSGPKQQEPVKPSPRELEAKQQDKSKQHLKEEAAKLQEAHKHQAKEPDPKPVAKSADAKHRQDETKQHDKEKEPKHAQQDATKQHEKDAEARHQKQDDAKQHEMEKETKHAQSDGSKSRDKDSEAKQHSDKQDSAKDHGKDTDAKQHHGKKAEQEKAAKEKAEAEAAAKAKAEADAKAKADAEAAAKAKSVADAAAAAKAKADADAAKAKLATTTTPQPTDSPKDAPATTDSKTADATAAPADSAAPAATGAPQSVTTAFADTPAKLGGPVQDTSTDAPTKTAAPVQQVASAPDGSKDRARKADDRGGVRRGSFTLFAPSQETYHANQFLAPKPSPKLLAEMEKRGYALQPPSVGDAVLVTLPSGAGDAWDVQRELESKFPDQRFGLNYIYKPYHPQQGTGSRTGSREGIPLSDRRGLSGRCTEEVCYGRKLIDWRPALGACAAGLKIGLIDTLVDRDHPAFAKTRLDIVNLALKNDAPPAPHWHATGVLSVLAGDEKRSIPSLIPRAEFTAVNVFFTNKNGELETDTAHLTEALAYLDEKVGVPIVNMSLVGPKDDLVHKRITDMATGRGVVFVAAAGNGGPGAPAGYPAAYDEVIAVTAVDSKGGNYGHANRGDYIDLAAPGVQILTSLPGGTEGFSTGTSFATPFVTAVVAAAYRDAKIGPAGRDGLFNPKRVMLDKLLGKEGLKKRDPILGYGLIKAPSACGSQDQPWLSVVKATPAPAAPIATAPLGRLPAASIAIDTWRPVVEQASLPSEATH